MKIRKKLFDQRYAFFIERIYKLKTLNLQYFIKKNY